MKKFTVIFILFLLIPSGCRAKNSPKICFKQTCLRLEIADTQNARINGLMFRKSLPDKSGMLFVFPVEDIYSFWMKNTLIPLDMIWLDKNYKVVHIKSWVPACVTDDCPSYDPGVKAMYVLEVNAGFTELYQIKINDKAYLENDRFK